MNASYKRMLIGAFFIAFATLGAHFYIANLDHSSVNPLRGAGNLILINLLFTSGLGFYLKGFLSHD